MSGTPATVGPCYGPTAGGGSASVQPQGALGQLQLEGVYLFVNNPGSPIATAQYLGPAQDIGVPEPGTLSLLLGALGGGWLARRRRKEQVADSS